MARVTIWPQTFGATLTSIIVSIAAGIMKLTENISIFDNVDANWSNLQQPVDTSMIQPNRRGRLGLQLIIAGFVCLFYGANLMISRPTKSEETEILKQKKNKRINEQKENTLDGSESSVYQQSKEESEEEEELRIRDALAWKRRHFIMMWLVIAVFVTIIDNRVDSWYIYENMSETILLSSVLLWYFYFLSKWIRNSLEFIKKNIRNS